MFGLIKSLSNFPLIWMKSSSQVALQPDTIFIIIN